MGLRCDDDGGGGGDMEFSVSPSTSSETYAILISFNTILSRILCMNIVITI